MKTGWRAFRMWSLFLLLFSSVSFAGITVEGVLNGNTRWTLADSPILLSGDLTVAQGAVLDIESGVVVTAGPTDGQSSGEDPQRVEFIVAGTLNTLGKPDAQVVFTSTHGIGSWMGLRFEMFGGMSTLNHTVLENAQRAITAYAPVNVMDSVLRSHQDSCVVQFGSTVVLERSKLEGCGRDAVYSAAGSTLVMKFTSVTNSGTMQLAVRIQGNARLENCTIAGNNYGGLDLFGNVPVVVLNTIVAFNGRYGIRYTGLGSLSYSYSNNFGHVINTSGKTVSGSNNLSTDPKFVGFTDLSLQPTSPCRGAGQGGSDMGAVPYKEKIKRLVASVSRIDTHVKRSTLLSVEARDESDLPVAANFTWTVDSSIGTVSVDPADSSKATFSAGCSLGEFLEALRISAGGKYASVTIKVEAGNAKALKMMPQDVTVMAGENVTFAAQAADECGNPVATNVTWASSAGSITSAGVLTAPTVPKTYTDAVSALMGTLSAKATVRVTSGAVTELTLTTALVTSPVREKMMLSAVAKDKFGNISTAPITWTVEAAAGSISGAGEWTAGTKAGTYADAITAQLDGLTAKATAVVTPGPTSNIEINPKAAKSAPKGVTTFVAVVSDAYGNATQDKVEWSTTYADVGSLTDGTFTAGTKAGAFPGAIRAKVGSLQATANIDIEPGALSQLVLTPNKVTLKTGNTFTFTALAKDEFGNPVSVSASWSAPKGGEISPQGVFTAGPLVGTFENAVMVQMGGLAATATVVVVPGPVAFLKVTPEVIEVAAAAEQTFKAQGKDFYGNNIEAPDVLWNCDAHAGNIDTEGVFTARAVDGLFPKGVTATSNGVTASASVRVVKTTSNRIEASSCSHAGRAGLTPWMALGLVLLRLRRKPKA